MPFPTSHLKGPGFGIDFNEDISLQEKCGHWLLEVIFFPLFFPTFFFPVSRDHIICTGKPMGIRD